MDAHTTAVVAQAVAPFFAKGSITLIMVLVVREMVRKAIALRKAGTKKQLARFICIFIFNTIGILPIIYLVFFQKKGKK